MTLKIIYDSKDGHVFKSVGDEDFTINEWVDHRQLEVRTASPSAVFKVALAVKDKRLNTGEVELYIQGETKLLKMEITADGRIPKWPWPQTAKVKKPGIRKKHKGR